MMRSREAENEEMSQNIHNREALSKDFCSQPSGVVSPNCSNASMSGAGLYSYQNGAPRPPQSNVELLDTPEILHSRRLTTSPEQVHSAEGTEAYFSSVVPTTSRFVEYFEYSSLPSPELDYESESATCGSRLSSQTELSTIPEESETGSSERSSVEQGSRCVSPEHGPCDINTTLPPTSLEALSSHPHELGPERTDPRSPFTLTYIDKTPERLSRSRKGSEEIPPSAVVVFDEESQPNTISRNPSLGVKPTRSALKRGHSLPELNRPVLIESQRSLSDPGLHFGQPSSAELTSLKSSTQRSTRRLSAFTFGQDPEEVEAAARGQVRALSVVSPTSEHPPIIEEHHERISKGHPRTLQVSKPVQALTPVRTAHSTQAINMSALLTKLLDKINVPIGRGSWRAAEWCDFEATPASIRRCCQNMLQKQWTRRIPFIQKQSPASTASTHLQTVINKVADVPGLPKLVVVDFCAGGGGPTPIFEQIINDERRKKGSTPLEFRLCDLYPNTGAWEGFSKKSEHLSYIAASVDARSPPPEVKSTRAPRKSLRFTSSTHPPTKNESRIFRLFNLSFHHFDDATAQSVIRSTLTSSDGFAIIELQDRRLGCLAMFFLNVFTSLILTPLWFPFRKNKTQYALTYSGILPFVLWWDGLASCLRTRGFNDFLEIVGKVDKGVLVEEVGGDEEGRCVRWGEWTFEYQRELHTFPFGYVSWITGTRTLGRVDSVVLARERLGVGSSKERVE